MGDSTLNGKPFKITNVTGKVRKGVVANSLYDLTSKVRKKFGYQDEDEVSVVWEIDGTEIDDEKYFATLKPNTTLMILKGDQKWGQPFPPCMCADQVDNVRGGLELINLIKKLKQDLYHFSLLETRDLELLSDMDLDSLVDKKCPDKIFLEQLKEASNRFLTERRQAENALELLKLYHENKAEESEVQVEFE